MPVVAAWGNTARRHGWASVRRLQLRGLLSVGGHCRRHFTRDSATCLAIGRALWLASNFWHQLGLVLRLCLRLQLSGFVVRVCLGVIIVRSVVALAIRATTCMPVTLK